MKSSHQATSDKKKTTYEIIESFIKTKMVEDRAEITTDTLDGIKHYGKRQFGVVHSIGNYVRRFQEMLNDLRLVPVEKFKREPVGGGHKYMVWIFNGESFNLNVPNQYFGKGN